MAAARQNHWPVSVDIVKELLMLIYDILNRITHFTYPQSFRHTCMHHSTLLHTIIKGYLKMGLGFYCLSIFTYEIKSMNQHQRSLHLITKLQVSNNYVPIVCKLTYKPKAPS